MQRASSPTKGLIPTRGQFEAAMPKVEKEFKALVTVYEQNRPEEIKAAIADTLNKIDGESGLAGLQIMLGVLAHCTVVDVRVRDVVDDKGGIRVETPEAIKSLILKKLFDANRAPLQLVHTDSITLRSVTKIMWWCALFKVISNVFWSVRYVQQHLKQRRLASEPYVPFDNSDKKVMAWLIFNVCMTYLGQGGFYLYSVQGTAKDIHNCMRTMADVRMELEGTPDLKPSSLGANRRYRLDILKDCPHASMFAVLSPSMQPLTVNQMQFVQHQGVGGVAFEMAYGDTPCQPTRSSSSAVRHAVQKRQRAGPSRHAVQSRKLVPYVLGLPTRLVSALWYAPPSMAADDDVLKEDGLLRGGGLRGQGGKRRTASDRDARYERNAQGENIRPLGHQGMGLSSATNANNHWWVRHGARLDHWLYDRSKYYLNGGHGHPAQASEDVQFTEGDPPLAEPGMVTDSALAWAARNGNVRRARLVSSPYLRCVQTAYVFAAALPHIAFADVVTSDEITETVCARLRDAVWGGHLLTSPAHDLGHVLSDTVDRFGIVAPEFAPADGGGDDAVFYFTHKGVIGEDDCPYACVVPR